MSTAATVNSALGTVAHWYVAGVERTAQLALVAIRPKRVVRRRQEVSRSTRYQLRAWVWRQALPLESPRTLLSFQARHRTNNGETECRQAMPPERHRQGGVRPLCHHGAETGPRFRTDQAQHED